MMCSNLKILNFVVGLLCLLSVSCTKNNADESTIVYPQKLIEGVKSLNYMGQAQDNELFPSYIMQANGLRNKYSKSKFAMEYITNDLFIKMKNPGKGVKVEIILKESEINEETPAAMIISSDEEILDIQIPVNWKFKNLRNWRRNNLVNLSWEVKLDDKSVEQYMKTFICRSVNSAYFTVLLKKEEPINIEKATEELGELPWQINNEHTICILLGDLIVGYIDEHSPLIEELKKEVIFDKYVTCLNGAASSTNEELLDNVNAYSYLMQKYRIAYGNKSDNNFQYVRTIDDLFSAHQGYCVELTAAFASWAQDLGLDVYLHWSPTHVYPSIKGKQGEIYVWDPNLLCYLDYPDLSNPSEENFEIAKNNFEIILKKSAEELETDKANSKVNQTIRLYDTRYYIPSLNISESYWENKTRSGNDSLKLVDRSKWSKFNNNTLNSIQYK